LKHGGKNVYEDKQDRKERQLSTFSGVWVIEYHTYDEKEALSLLFDALEEKWCKVVNGSLDFREDSS
jgi:hypothetical protein